MKDTQFRSRHVLVVGMARSGVGAAELLCSIGAVVTVNDSKTEEELGDALAPLQNLPVIRRFGTPALECLAGQEVLILSPGIPDTVPFVAEARKQGIRVIAEIELAYELMAGELLAVTGTNGKTTTVTLLTQMFLDAGRPAHAVGNIGYPYSLAVKDAGERDVFVCECSSFQMETVDGFHPRAAALLNITEDHLNRHGTMAEYTRLKMRMFEKQDEKDYAVFNLDDPGVNGLWNQLKSHILFFSRTREVPEGAFVRDGVVMFRLDGKEYSIIPAAEIYIPGPHNLENAMAAVCLAMVSGLSPESIAETLRTFKGVEHRIEFTRELDGIRYYNDSKGTNVDSTICAVKTMDRPTVMILGGSDKHADFAPLASCIMEHPLIRRAVVMGVTGPQIEKALKDAGFAEIIHASGMEDAVNKSRDAALEGWNVLLSPACASFDMFTDYEQRGRVFKKIVADLPART